MNANRGLLLFIALSICLPMGAGVYFLLGQYQLSDGALHQSIATVNPSIISPFPEATPSAQIENVAPSMKPKVALEAALLYQYNARGQIQTITYQDGSVYTCAYNTNGDKIRETTRTGKTWCYVYDQNQAPISVIDPEGRVMHPTASSTAGK